MRHAQGKKYNSLMNALLTPLTWITGAYISSMDFLRQHGILKTEEPSLPLISVGNLTYGGTNKTPFVEMLAKFSHSRGIKAGIVTRGYTGNTRKPIIILNGQGERELTGDEPLMLSRNLPEVPVAVARQRIEGVKALRSFGAELVIADDAFQHKALGRDADIVLIDSLCPFGNGRLTPAGILREKTEALSRADIVVLTKTGQVKHEDIASIMETVKQYVSAEKIFTSRLESDGFMLFGTDETPKAGLKVFAFSAIGNPESFMRSLEEYGFAVAGHKSFTDHHKYTCNDLKELSLLAGKSNADVMICTEKDLYNLPAKDTWPFSIPLVIPKVKAVLNEPERFFAALNECLKPKVVVASNGYGEDAIGVMLAKKLRKILPEAEIFAFPLVGKGEAYSQAGFAVKSAPSVTPSGGVVKYSVRDLLGDMRAGLLKHIRSQLKDWRKIARAVRTPICVGDVYLLVHTLWGSGARPMFCATAKTVYLSGHWRIERAVINRFTLRTWTRDAKSAEQLGGRAVYSGSPVMDLLFEDGGEIHEHTKGDTILLLPGSRIRACRDVKLLLDAVVLLSSKDQNSFRMVLAPTLPLEEFFASCVAYGWAVGSDTLTRDGITITLTHENIACAAQGAKILLGLGGTANQLCAGLGIPVVSIDEKGKRVQKKLLGDAEILTEAKPEALAECVLRVLNDSELYESMSSAGRERMGQPGALDAIADYACDALGWDIRENVYRKFQGRM